MKIPTVHLNGTSRNALIEQARRVYDAVSEALVALQDAAPHGRDYYVQSDEAYQIAALEHTERVKALTKIQDDMQQIAIGVQQQGAQALSNSGVR